MHLYETNSLRAVLKCLYKQYYTFAGTSIYSRTYRKPDLDMILSKPTYQGRDEKFSSDFHRNMC